MVGSSSPRLTFWGSTSHSPLDLQAPLPRRGWRRPDAPPSTAPGRTAGLDAEARPRACRRRGRKPLRFPGRAPLACARGGFGRGRHQAPPRRPLDDQPRAGEAIPTAPRGVIRRQPPGQQRLDPLRRCYGSSHGRRQVLGLPGFGGLRRATRDRRTTAVGRRDPRSRTVQPLISRVAFWAGNPPACSSLGARDHTDGGLRPMKHPPRKNRPFDQPGGDHGTSQGRRQPRSAGRYRVSGSLTVLVAV